MTDGIVRFYFSHVEPEDKGLLWLRPHLNDDSFDIVYFGVNGWTKWCPRCKDKPYQDIIDSECPDKDYSEEPPVKGEFPCGCDN